MLIILDSEQRTGWHCLEPMLMPQDLCYCLLIDPPLIVIREAIVSILVNQLHQSVTACSGGRSAASAVRRPRRSVIVNLYCLSSYYLHLSCQLPYSLPRTGRKPERQFKHLQSRPSTTFPTPDLPDQLRPDIQRKKFSFL